MKVLMKEVEMISYFSPKSSPQPIRFRLDSDEKEEKIVVPIQHITGVKKDKKAGNPMLIYSCQAVINGSVKPLELIYEASSYKWFLFKI